VERASSIDRQELSLREPEIDSSQASNDIQILTVKVVELQATLQEKDRTIRDLEAKIWAIENVDAYSMAIAETEDACP
jgi:peptidoglycan hydrolase CwlO-like protein